MAQPSESLKGKAIIIVGGTGQGKSTLIRNILKKGNPNCIINDIQRTDYPFLPEHKAGEPQPRERCLNAAPEYFKKLAANRKKSIIVFEEATGYLMGGTCETMRKILTDKRHYENCIIYVFHSVSTIPPTLLDLVNYMYIFKTADAPSRVKRKYEPIFEVWQQIKEKPEKNSYIQPHAFVDLLNSKIEIHG